MLTIALAAGGALVGGAIGVWIGDREGGTYNFAPVIYGPIGALAGCFTGTVVGQIIS